MADTTWLQRAASALQAFRKSEHPGVSLARDLLWVIAVVGGIALALYIVAHELIHVVRFSRFLHAFHTYPPELCEEESRVHDLTCTLLSRLPLPGVPEVVAAYRGAAGMETFESEA